jgi:hypothetical protein
VRLLIASFTIGVVSGARCDVGAVAWGLLLLRVDRVWLAHRARRRSRRSSNFMRRTAALPGSSRVSVIPPKADVPFTLTLQTEWVRTLYDGGTIASVNQPKIARRRDTIYRVPIFL